MDRGEAHRCRGVSRIRSALPILVALGLALAALGAPVGAAIADPNGSSQGGEQSLSVWAYFDGDTPVSGGRVRVYDSDGRELRGDGPGPARTFPEGMALVRFDSLPSTVRIVVSGGRAGGERLRGSLTAKVRGVTDGDLVHVNPVTTVSNLLAHAEDGLGLRHARQLTERTLGIRRVLDNSDLYATDRWFQGDRFLRWALEGGSIGAGARALVQLIEEPGFDRRTFRPRDAGRSKTRAVVSGGASDVLNRMVAATPCPGADHAVGVINGLADAIAGASALTGPQGFAVGAAAVVFKKLIELGLGSCVVKSDSEDPVQAALRGISAQVAEVKDHVEKKFLQLQIKPTEDMVTDINSTQQKLQNTMKWAKEVEKTNPGTTERAIRVADLNESLKQFLRGARDLVDHNVAAHLDKALRDKQEAGDPANPLKGPPLIPAVRDEVAKERFFTNESSQTIRRFFRYYEWAQTQLATVLTEYYTLGGGCALSFVEDLRHTKDLLTSNDCTPVLGVAAGDVKTITKNIEAQRATLPAKILDPRVVIDRTNRRMWLLKTDFRQSPQIMDGGLVFEEITGTKNRRRYALNNSARGLTAYPTDWDVPTANDYRELFAGASEPLARLNSLGVNYNGKELQGRPDLWLKGDFYVYNNAASGHGAIDAAVFNLAPGRKSPDVNIVTLADECSINKQSRPDCRIFTGGHGAYIVWSRSQLSDAEGGNYWCQPGKEPSWHPAKC
jgi:hypothetical protein